MEERQAILRLQRGDLSGLEVLVKLYQVKAVHAACLIVQDKAVAEDIVQNAFIVAAEKIHQYDPMRPFGPWFFRSVINASIKAANRQKRMTSLENMQDQDDTTLESLLTDPQPRPEEWFELEEIRQRIWRAVNRLTPDQKAVIVMRYFLEMSENEMVEHLQKPRSTIKFWLRKARDQLRRSLHLVSIYQESAHERPHINWNKNDKRA